MKKIQSLSAVMIVLVSLPLLFSFFKKQVPSSQETIPSTQEGILQEMIRTYDPDKDSAAYTPYLEALAMQDEDIARQWEEIMHFWEYANTEMAITDTPPDDLKDIDGLCIIVLGYQLNADGSMRDELTGRLKKAKLCAEKFPDSYVLCTGGGTAARNQQATEACVMADWLIENGMDPDRILMEAASMTTTENAIFSCDLLQKSHPEIRSVILVTSDYHIPWGAVLFQTKFILAGTDLKIVSNTALPTNTVSSYPILEYQRVGILKIAGLQ